MGEAPWLWQSYLQLELQLSAVARLLARDGDLAAQLQRHGAVQDAWRMRGKSNVLEAFFVLFASFCQTLRSYLCSERKACSSRSPRLCLGM